MPLSSQITVTKPHCCCENRFWLLRFWRLNLLGNRSSENLGPLADRFGVGESTAHAIVHDTCKAIVQHFMPRLVSWPSTVTEATDVMDGLDHSRHPNRCSSWADGGLCLCQGHGVGLCPGQGASVMRLRWQRSPQLLHLQFLSTVGRRKGVVGVRDQQMEGWRSDRCNTEDFLAPGQLQLHPAVHTDST